MGGAGSIPFLSIDAYARRYGIEGDDFEWFSSLIRAADRAWTKWNNEKRAKK